jgi:hypothetical protein
MLRYKLDLCLTKYYSIKIYRRSGSIAPCILNISSKMEVSDQLHAPVLLNIHHIKSISNNCSGFHIGYGKKKDAEINGSKYFSNFATFSKDVTYSFIMIFLYSDCKT